MAGKITALVQQKRNKERVNVHIDGEFAFGLAMIEALKLEKGQHLTDADIERLKALDEVEKAHERALNYLSYRPRSGEEVRRNLEEKYPQIAVEEVIERLERVGLIDDAAFARFWVENRNQFKPRSARAIRYELRRKGVSDQVIDAAISDLDEVDAAYRAATDRASRYIRKGEEVFRKRMTGYLARRGFSYGIIRDVLDRVWSELASEET